MNTLFVILIWTFFTYLFFFPLSKIEYMESMMELIYLEYMDDIDT